MLDYFGREVILSMYINKFIKLRKKESLKTIVIDVDIRLH